MKGGTIVVAIIKDPVMVDRHCVRSMRFSQTDMMMASSHTHMERNYV